MHTVRTRSPFATMTVVRPQNNTSSLTSLELFTGAGGLALGVAEAGFQHLAVVEKDRDACRSLRENATRVAAMTGWPIHEGDARKFDLKPFAGRTIMLAAGAPCQPFSLGGKHEGHNDERNLFPVVFDAVATLRPKAVLIENVKGLTRPAFEPYLRYIEARIRFPHIGRRSGESWRTHRNRLVATKADKVLPEDCYTVGHVILNAADFGLPQWRERVFIVGFRGDLAVDWDKDFLHRMRPHFSGDALLYAKWISGEYWKQHNIPVFSIPQVSDRERPRVGKLQNSSAPTLPRWRTVRDALRSEDALMGWTPLPEPRDHEDWPGIVNHASNPGARCYRGHSGSDWDSPAKTLKAGHHGVPGGENILRLTPETVRYFTVREAARLQGFPDEYAFQGAWYQAFRQVGNSVPVRLARYVASTIAEILEAKDSAAKAAAPSGAPISIQ